MLLEEPQRFILGPHIIGHLSSHPNRFVEMLNDGKGSGKWALKIPTYQPTYSVWHFHAEPFLPRRQRDNRRIWWTLSLNTGHLTSSQTSMRNVRSYWLWNTFSPYSSVTKSRDRTDQDPSEPSPSTSPSPPSSQTVARALSRASVPRFFFPWCGTHREHVRIKKNLEWLSNAASSKAKLASCQQGEERRGRTNDVCRVPCSVPASSPSTSALPSATDVRRPHRQLRSDNELCPVCVSASLV